MPRRRLHAALIGLAALGLPVAPAWATERWMLMSRHGECAPTSSLQRRIPDMGRVESPQAFAALMKQRGHAVTLAPMPTPAGTSYEVNVPEQRLALVFVPAAACGATGGR